jgi:hypothetical protein
MKSMKIPRWLTQSANPKTDNTMAPKKSLHWKGLNNMNPTEMGLSSGASEG